MTLPIVLLGTATSYSAEKAGAITGGILFCLALLFGVIKCCQILRRPTASKLCVSALLLVLVGWGISSGSAGLAAAFNLPKSGPLVLATGLLTVLFMLVALILGIVGLSLFDSRRYTQGRGQGIWAVVLSGLMLLVFMTGAVVAAFKQADKASLGNLNQTEASSGRIALQAYNFSLEPNSQWRVLQDPKVLSPEACLAMRIVKENVFALVIAEEVGAGLDTPTLVQAIKLNMETAAEVLHQTEENRQFNGVDFVRVQSEARLDDTKMELAYEHWIASQGGRCWQIVVWSDRKSRAVVARRAEELARTFNVLDTALAGGAIVKDRDRPAWGYATHLEPLDWNAWDDKTQHTALADFSAQRHLEGLMVVPIRFPGEAPDMEATTRALLSTMDFEHPAPADEDGASSSVWLTGKTGGEGRELRRQRTGDDGLSYHYVMRVIRWSRAAVLVAGWTVEGRGDMDLVTRSIDAVTLSEPEGEIPVLGAPEQEAYGVACNQAGLAYFAREDYAAAVRWFKTGFEATHTDPAMLDNVLLSMENSGRSAEALEYFATHQARFADHVELGVRQARLLALQGRVQEGLGTFLQLMDKGLRDENELWGWLNLLVGQEEYPSAVESVEKWLARLPSPNVRRWHAQTVSSSGNHERAVQLFEALANENPADRRAAYDLAQAYNEAGEHSKAGAVAEKILTEETDAPRALLVLGWSQMGRKWYRDAKATFERAARKSPRDEEIQDAIRTASAALGQGNNSDIKEPVAPVEMPPEVASALAQADAPANFGEGHAYASLLRSTGYHFEKGKPARRTLYRRLKVLTAQGAEELSSLQIAFSPVSERIYMNRLEVKDASGRVTGKASLEDAYVRDLDDGTASFNQVLHMQVEGVQPGSIIECEVTIEDRSPADAFEFQRHLFASVMPVAEETVFVTGQVGEVKAHLTQGDKVKTLRTDSLAAWIAPAQPAEPSESYSLWAERRCPMLWLGGRDGTWETVAHEYLKDVSDRLVVDKTVTDLAAQLVEGRTTPREKTAAIARYIQKEIAYKAIEFGVRARRPNACADTLRLRYGDCKDQSLLVHLLLKAAGVPSHLALVNTDWETTPGLPTLDQFNHMVVHVPALGENWLLDPTDRHLDLGHLPADRLWHAQALVLDPEAPRLLPRAKAAPAGSCRVVNQRTVTPKGRDWEVADTLELHGYYASWMRQAFIGLNPTEQRAKIQALLSVQGQVQVEEFRFEALEAPDEPARLVTAYRVPGGVKADGDKRQGSLPALWERDYLATSYIKDRQTPFEFVYPVHLNSRTLLQLPSGAAPSGTNSLRKSAGTPYNSWSMEPATGEDGLLTVNFEFSAKTGEYPPAEYMAFHEAWETARRVWESPIQWVEK